MLSAGKKVLVIAPHPDDEVLGAGGTIARFALEGREVNVAVITRGKQPRFTVNAVEQVRNEALRAHQILGVKQTLWLDYPAAALGEVPHAELNAGLSGLVKTLRPDVLLIPFVGDMHLDHQLIFTSALVAGRPHEDAFPRLILAYETLSETNWNAPYLTPGFIPNVFIDISAQLDTKLEALSAFQSQLRQPPHERSLVSVQALATLRGATVLTKAAEAYVMIRAVA